MSELDVEVLIVGGGGCGLAASVFLSDIGVDHLLIERHPTTSHWPKAHYLNPRTMEILRQHGVAQDVYAAGMPMADAAVRYVTSLGGDGPQDRRELGVSDAFGGGSLRELYERIAPGPPTNLPQIRLEPILRRHAEERAPGRIRFGHELVSWTQSDTGVSAQVRDRDADTTMEVRARFLVAADGGKTIGPELGVRMEGPTGLGNMKTYHVTADLSEYMPGDALITHVIRPGSRFRRATIRPQGPTWGKHCEEWGIGVAFRAGDEQEVSDADAPAVIREALNLPDIPIKLHIGYDWSIERVVADRFQFGRILLAGDAAHRHSPSGGLGLNSAVHDAHNLTWKLAMACSGAAGAELVGSYEDERRPVDVRNADWALSSSMNNQMIDAAFEVAASFPGAVEGARAATAEAFRIRSGEILATQRVEFAALGIELGYVYESSAVVPDGTPEPERDPLGCGYQPIARPGSRLPHAWLSSGTQRISTHDLVGSGGGFALLTDTAGADWCVAAKAVARRLGVSIRAVTIAASDESGGDFTDTTGQWADLNGLGRGGAVLVRPDNFVGFRAGIAVEDPIPALETTLRAILGLIPRS